ncbi:MAG: hypothetical protein AAGU14_01865 [Eubacteriaceae bacterium]
MNSESSKLMKILKMLYMFIKPAIIFLLFLLMFIWGMQITNQSSRKEDISAAEKSIQKAAVTCYAIEGRYPPSYEYLKQNYAIDINTDKYAVFYSVFASNIMPDITVLEKQ